MDLPGPGRPGYQIGSRSLVFVSLKREPDNEVHDRLDTAIPAELDCVDDIADRMAPAEEAEDPVAAGLGPEVELRIGAVSLYQRERLGADKFRAHLAWERAEIDLVPEGFEEMLNLVPAGMDPVGPVRKRVGRDEPGLPVPVRVPGNLIDGAVPHAVAEDLRGLAVAAGERAAPGDLDIAFHAGKCRVRVEVHAGVGLHCMIPGDDPRNMAVAPVFEVPEKAGERIFPFAGDDITGILRHFPGAGRGMRPARDGDAAGPGYLVPVPGCIDRVEAVAGDIPGRRIDRIQPDPVTFTGSAQDRLGIPGRVDDPPVDLHDERRSVFGR